MRIPFISKSEPSSVADKTAANDMSDFKVLTEKEYQAVAGGPQVENDPQA
jgi:hypothetical protein